MIRSLATVIGGLAILSATAVNADPGATISVKSSTSTHTRWNGHGDLIREVPLCILSDTGGFVLQVTSQSASESAAGQIEFLLEDPSGSTSAAKGAPGTIAILDGVVDPAADCRGGSNARLRVTFPREQLLAGVAGDLALDLQFSVRPR